MNNYIMKRINIYGTEIQLLEAIRDFFINNTVMGFSFMEENLTNEADKQNYIKVKNDDYILAFTGAPFNNDNTSSNIIWTIFENNESTNVLISRDIGFSSSASKRTTSTSRIINIFIVKGDNLDFMNIASYSSTFGKNSSPFYMRMATSDVGLVYYRGPSTSNIEVIDYETKSLHYELNPYHTIATSDDTLILDSELPLRTTTSIKYYSGTVDECFGLGGGTVGTFYKDSNGTPLYCFANNCCFKLENNVDAEI